MTKIKKKVFITDVDGVLLKWQSMLPFFAQQYGICLDNILEIQTTEEFKHTSELFHCTKSVSQKLKREYHESDYMKMLSAYDDALDFVNKHKDVFEFVAITALEPSEKTYKNRMFNLNTLFPGAFTQIVLTGNNKQQAITDVLIGLKNRGKEVIAYCDDLVEHCDSFENACDDVGTKADVFHFVRGPRSTKDEFYHTVNSWKDVETILGIDNE